MFKVSPYVTLSIGIAGIQNIGHFLPENLIKAADNALYHAKDIGRDRIVLDSHLECGNLSSLIS